MLTINDLTHYLGTKELYDQLSLQIKPKEKIALIGLNGTGKSTLLRLIAGELTPDSGSITKSKECSIGFLNQDLLSYQPTISIRHVALQAFETTLAIQQKIDHVLHQMEVNYTDALVDKLADLQATLEQMGGYEIQAKAEAMLEGVGFTTQDLDRSISEFSGGWRMRVMLAKLLLQKPALLMLDEPTNHLDLTSIQWIETYLQNYDSAFIVVSHDRSFLDNVTTKTIEIAHKQLHVYMGNYTFYETEKQERELLQQQAYANQQQKVKQTERFIERFRSKASKASQVQSRVKSLARMEKIEPVTQKTAGIMLNFGIQARPGKIVAELTNVSKSFGSLEILKNANAQIERGDKIALIGANGRGKSTVLRLIANQEIPNSLGHNVTLSFYAQHQLEALNLENELLEELKQVGTAHTETDLRRIAGMLLFKKEDVFKKIKVLSGGERSRVALAKVLLAEANFLLLDEPTNHLDMFSIDRLAQTLRNYPGTCLFVSHDRHFIAQIATKIWYIENQQIKTYPGTYQDYMYWQQQVKK